MSEATSRRIRAIFNTFNFWSIVLYNILALNSLDFAKLVSKRLLLKGAFVYLFLNFEAGFIFDKLFLTVQISYLPRLPYNHHHRLVCDLLPDSSD